MPGLCEGNERKLLGMTHPGDEVSAAQKNAPPDALPRPAAELARLAIVLPAWEPPPALLAFVGDLRSRGFESIVVVNDGSSARCAAMFAALDALPGIKVLCHAKNRGKGRALKTAFAYLLQQPAGLRGVMMADADGQHQAEDVEQVARALLASDGRVVLGVRGFEPESRVPWRSRAGNRLGRVFFALLTGVWIRDTQTGLRGLPIQTVPALLAVKGERYEYEMLMLAELCRQGAAPIEVPIATIYHDQNRGSRFHPVRDSGRVLWALLRCFVSWKRGHLPSRRREQASANAAGERGAAIPRVPIS